jgi:hypothetical protein
MAAISLQSLSYFKNNGLMKRFALKKNLHSKKPVNKKVAENPPHENVSASPPIPAKPPPPLLAPFSPPLTPRLPGLMALLPSFL